MNELYARYKNRGAVIDSNLLLLFFIGNYDTALISKFKRTRKYTVDDFALISNIFGYFNPVVATPNILTEVSNLSNQLTGKTRQEYFDDFVNRIELLEEQYCPSVQACSHPYFAKCGLTDSGIMKIALGKYLVFTDDFPLTGMLESLNIDVVNFNHIRGLLGW